MTKLSYKVGTETTFSYDKALEIHNRTGYDIEKVYLPIQEKRTYDKDYATKLCNAIRGIARQGQEKF